MLTVLAAADLNILNDLSEKTQTFKTSMNKLTKSLNAKTSLARTKEREQISLKNSRAKKRKILDELLKDEKLQEELNRKHAEDLERAQALLGKFIKDREKAKIPVPSMLKNYNFASYKGKLPWPVNGKVVSQFGKVVDPKTKTETNNRGIEIETKQGEPVSTVGSGVVVMTQFIRGYGNFVMISHPPSYYSIYGHLSDFLVNIGDVVMEGDIIGLAGNTGMIDNSSSRLVLEILQKEKPENPLSWLSQDRRRASR